MNKICKMSVLLTALCSVKANALPSPKVHTNPAFPHVNGYLKMDFAPDMCKSMTTYTPGSGFQENTINKPVYTSAGFNPYWQISNYSPIGDQHIYPFKCSGFKADDIDGYVKILKRIYVQQMQCYTKPHLFFYFYDGNRPVTYHDMNLDFKPWDSDPGDWIADTGSKYDNAHGYPIKIDGFYPLTFTLSCVGFGGYRWSTIQLQTSL